MIKTLKESAKTLEHLVINPLQPSDISLIVNAFTQANWPKRASTFEMYYQEQLCFERLVWVAYVRGQVAGYVTLKWKSQYEPFAKEKIPEIMDLNVVPPFRNQGIGSHLLARAEGEAASKTDMVGIGVGLYGGADGGYGSAQRLYVNCGYIPDGKGITYDYRRPATPGDSFPLDDELVLWLTKKLR